MNARRFFTGLGVVAVAAVAGAISYRHQQHLAVTHGQPEALAVIWPLSVDGLVAATGIAISTDRAGGYRPRLWALVGFWAGVVVSVVTNWLATDGGLVNHGVSAFPALAFLLAVESLSAKPRPRRALANVEISTLAIAEISAITAPAVSDIVTDISTDTGSVVEQPKRPVSRTPKKPSTGEQIRRLRDRQPDATVSDIARRVGVTARTVERHLSALSAATNVATAAPAVSDNVSDIPSDSPAPHNGTALPDLVTVN